MPTFHDYKVGSFHYRDEQQEFLITFCQPKTEIVEGEEHEHRITSRINLVDLTGSEHCNTA